MGQYLLLNKYLLVARMGDWKDGQVERKKKEGWAGWWVGGWVDG